MDTYTRLAEDYASDEGRSSAESSEGFSFASAMDLRKNLTECFDKQVAKTSCSSKMSSASASSLSVTDRIAQFEQATKAAKPPLPLREQSNIIPANRLAVYLRIRPPLPASKENGNNTIDVLKPKHPNIHPTAVRTYPPAQSNTSKVNLHREGRDASSCAKEFEFHQVLEPETTQKTLYSTVAAPLVRSLFDAAVSTDKPRMAACESALLFSYGITNAGKTHTILGNIKSGNDAKWGVIPRAISDIFDQMKQLPRTAGHYDLYLSYFEIYNEQIYDLVPKKAARQKVGPPPMLKVRERQGQTIVRGLVKHKVTDVNHGIELTMMANNRRHTSSNNINSGSSRSHCVCQMQIVPRSSHAANANVVSKPSDDDASVVSMSGYSTDDEALFLSKQRSSTIWIVDLAGSERSKRTGMGISSARQKEASQINKSLMTLMRCLTVMRESGRQSSANVVPFRESKLSHVFMSHLTGSSASRTAMIVNVNPAVADFDETQHVLAYASQAKKIEMNPDELKKKRKQYFGDEYDMDGRKKAKSASSSLVEATKRLVSKVAKKLSPKKVARKLSPKKIFRGKGEKRKAAGTASNESSSADLNEPVHKRMKHPPTNSTSVSNSGDQAKEILSLKMAQNVAQAELELLRSEKADLVEELNQQESQIRMEVSQEMEERLRVSRERNNEELERLRSQINANPPPCRSTRKAQMDKTDKFIQELLDKVDECEEEMVRMRQTHAEEVDGLKAPLEDTKVRTLPSANDSKIIAELEKELAATRMQMERLEKSKIELIENYEKLLQEDEEDDADADADDDGPENQVPLWKQRILRSKANANAQSRKPLGTISGNVSDSNADKDWEGSAKREQWIFPKNPPSLEMGAYKRPSGRAPHGREWDASVGAWRLDAV